MTTSKEKHEADALQSLKQALSQLTMREPWFASAALQLEPRPQWSIPTAATDARCLYYNPEFISNLSTDELLFVICHEVLHCVFLHCLPSRLAGRERRKWNVAADAVINRILRGSGFSLLSFIVPPWPTDECVEIVYSKLTDDDLKDCFLNDDIVEIGLDEGSDDKTLELQSRWEGLASSIPGDLQRQIGKAKSNGEWLVKLAHEISGVKKGERKSDWSRRHRRLPDRLPGSRRLRRPLISICIDTSGSIDSDLLTRFVREACALVALYGLDVLLIAADAEVHEVLQGEEIQRIVSLKGGGGTSFGPAIEESEKQNADLCIYFTDAQGLYPEKPASMPVLWMVSGSGTPPWGCVVRLQ